MAKLYFKYGAMGSSKTAQALITKYNYEENDLNVWLIKPGTDTRDGAKILRSRIGLESPADVIAPGTDIYLLFQDTQEGKCDVIIVDECQFLTEEALKSVPDSYREGSFGLGAGKLRTVFRIVLPSAVPGILAGVILAIGRIVGETAALIYTAGSVAQIPKSVMGSGRTLAVHMYHLSSEGLYMDQAYATAVILLVLVVGINTLSGMIARKLTKA